MSENNLAQKVEIELKVINKKNFKKLAVMLTL